MTRVPPAGRFGPARATRPAATRPAATRPARVAALISGRGSNMLALADAAARPGCPFTIALVLSNRAEAAGLALAAARGLRTACVESRGRDREGFEAAVQAELERAGAEYVALAGFLRVLTPGFVARWEGRMLNIHPSLLPSFPGLNTHARALAAGVKLHGCTAHLVTAGVDEGPILAQAAVPVLPGDSEAGLAGRVLAQEHAVFPAALAALVSGIALPPAEGALANPLPVAAALPMDRVTRSG